MKRHVIIFSIIFISLGICFCSSSNTTGGKDIQPVYYRSWCDDHPDWNLCDHRDRLDPSDIMEHDNLINAKPGITTEKATSRLEICEKIVKEYNETHIYQKHYYDCDDMTLDIWNQLKKKYINAKIGLGNVTVKVENLWESSHAWIIAEIEPDIWVALDGVEGRVVHKKENPLYYYGWFFDTPLEYKRYRELVAQYNDELGYLNQLKQEYNSSVLSNEDRKNKKIIIDDREKKRIELQTKMVALSQGVKTANLNLFNNTN